MFNTNQFSKDNEAGGSLINCNKISLLNISIIQSRYVGYYGTVKKELDGCLPEDVPLNITLIRITGIQSKLYSL